jgi:hypothetical protein
MILDDLRRALELLPPTASVTLPRDVLLTALRFQRPAEPKRPDEPERWLTANDCAELLNVSARWCYEHGDELGIRRLSRRCVRFSSHAVARYMRRRG